MDLRPTYLSDLFARVVEPDGKSTGTQVIQATVTETKKTESAIVGDGHGSCHQWARVKTAQVGAGRKTEYLCKWCGEQFIHHYCQIPDIFEAMKSEKVSNQCIKVEEVN